MDTAEIIAVLSLLGNVIFAFVNFRLQRRDRESQILMDFHKRYGSSKMYESLTLLEKWRDEHRDKLLLWNDPQYDKEKVGYLIHRAAHDLTDFDELDRARRYVKRYFIEAYDYYQKEIISRELCKSICSVYANDIFLNVVAPLDFATKPKYVADQFTNIRNLLIDEDTSIIRAL
jgi:hypothetical protein